jgi:hypothetical protein
MLKIVLKQHYGEDLLLGRFRLYVTASAGPFGFWHS